MLNRVMTYELTAKQLDYLDGALATDDHSAGDEAVRRAIYDGRLQLWTWVTDDCEMVIVTEATTQPDGYRELLVRMLFGSGGIAEWVQVTEAFADAGCKSMNCDRVIAYVKADLWEKFKSHGVGEGVDELYMVIGKESV